LYFGDDPTSDRQGEAAAGPEQQGAGGERRADKRKSMAAEGRMTSQLVDEGACQGTWALSVPHTRSTGSTFQVPSPRTRGVAPSALLP
jgi:hypothetical protein